MPTHAYNTGHCLWKKCTCQMYVKLGEPANEDTYICDCGHSLEKHSNLKVVPADPTGCEGDMTPWVSSTWTPREPVVEELAKRLMLHRVILIRGTPASGKTILLRLLGSHLATFYPDIAVKAIEWYNFDNKTKPNAIEELIGETSSGLYSTISKCLIIDEGQTSYKDKKLWTMIKNLQYPASRGLLVVVAASYGSPIGRMMEFTELHPTPVQLSADAQFSLRWTARLDGEGIQAGLLLAKDEIKDIMIRELQRSGSSLTFADGLLDWLHAFTAGHVGAVCDLICLALKSTKLREFYYRNGQEPITPHDYRREVMGDMMEFRFSLGICQFGRGLPKDDFLQNIYIQDLMTDVITRGYTLDMTSLASQTCYKQGYLHKEVVGRKGEERLIFPSPVHAWYCAAALVPMKPVIDLNKYPDPLTLCKKVLKGFNARQLREAIRRPPTTSSQEDVEDEPPEAQYQDEFYRSACKELQHNCLPSPEFGIKGRQVGTGSIDFFFQGYDWGVELIAGGDRLEKHYKRFQEGGAYYAWIKDKTMKDWIILDLRTTTPRFKHPEFPNLYHVIFSDGYKKYKMIRASNLKDVDGFGLFKNRLK